MKEVFIYVWNYDILNKISIIIFALASIFFIISLISQKDIKKKHSTSIIPDRSILYFAIMYAALAIILTNTVPLNRDHREYEKQKQEELEKVWRNS